MLSSVRKTFCFCLFFVCIGVSAICSKMEHTENLSNIEAILEREAQTYAPEDILVVFDMYYTLVYPTSPYIHEQNIDKHKKIFKKIIGKISRRSADIMLSRLMVAQQPKLINDRLPEFLKKYSNVNFIVCSSSLEQNINAYLESLRRNNIKISNGYNLKNFRFSEFDEYLSGLPSYRDGVIVTNRKKKGEILVSFLKRVPRKPKLIIFIDNNTSKLRDLKDSLKDLTGVEKLITVQYTEYKHKSIRKLSQEEFEKYWEKQVWGSKNSPRY